MTLKSLSTLKRASYHKLPYDQRLVVLQNTMQEFYGNGGIEPLTLEDIDLDELRQAFTLARNPMYCGPFAGTHYESFGAWQYVSFFETDEERDAFSQAIDKGLWGKYIGLATWGYHEMGEIIHAFCSTAEGLLPDMATKWTMMSPATAAPSYAQAIGSAYSRAKALFIGAFSLQSIADIWALKRRLIRRGRIKIIDIQGFLSYAGAKHYEIPFMIGSGLAIPFKKHSQELVLTNFLTPDLDPHDRGDIDKLRSFRADLFREAYRVLAPQGQLAMVEPALMDEESFEHSEEVSAYADKACTKEQLKATGFRSINILKATLFSSRLAADRWIDTGQIRNKDTELSRNRFLIIARK